MPYRIIEEMPTQSDVESAEPRQLVAWHLFLRPTRMNEELFIVKAIAARYDRLPDQVREKLGVQVRQEHTL